MERIPTRRREVYLDKRVKSFENRLVPIEVLSSHICLVLIIFIIASISKSCYYILWN